MCEYMLKVEKFIVGELQTNCYLVKDEKTNKALLIDPGARDEILDEKIKFLGSSLEYILLTHGHFDHISAAKYYRDMTKAKIAISYEDSSFIEDSLLNMQDGFDIKVEPFVPDILLSDGDDIKFAGENIKVLSSPGHTGGSLCFMLNDMLFTGDTLMKNCMGRTDLPTGGKRTILNSLKLLYNLPGDYKIYPGHGEDTSLRLERVSNRYMIYANERL